MSAKLATAQAAAALIRDGDTIATSGFVGVGIPEELLIAIEKRFEETGAPSNLTVMFAAGQGDGGTRGLNRLGHDGLLSRAIGGHWGLIPKVGALALSSKIEAWNLPQGVISQLFREIAAGRKGVVTRVGIGTFVDPRLEGGKINDRTEDLVQLVELGGEEMLFYPSLPIDVALLRATTADPDGNLSMEREALFLDNLAMATAVRNSGGLVIAQVERLCGRGSLNPKSVVVPSALVDVVVVAEPQNHTQTFATGYSPVFSGEIRAPAGVAEDVVLDVRKVIARRCAMELPPGGVVNLGIGMPEGVAAVAEEEGVLDAVTLTAEPGILGGRPASGLDFGAAVNPDAIIPQSAQFDFYDGGGLDLAILGMAEADRHGNVNVSRFGGRLAGAGGFINISQNAKKVVFAGTFSAGGFRAKVADNALHIETEGKVPKFVSDVEQITFSAKTAAALGTEVIYVTERAVFRLRDGKVLLTEIAPGIDLEKDILNQISFTPEMSKVEEMATDIFNDGRMDLDGLLFDLNLEDRVVLDEAQNCLYLNFEGLCTRTLADVERIKEAVLAEIAHCDKRVNVVVNYNKFDLPPDLSADFASMVRNLEEHHYDVVTRYTSNAFMRLKLKDALSRSSAPHLFETGEEARAFLNSQND